MKKNIRTILIYFLLIGIVIFIVAGALGDMNSTPKKNDGELLTLFARLTNGEEGEKVKNFTLDAEGNLTVITSENQKITKRIQDREYFLEHYVAKYVNPYNEDPEKFGGEAGDYIDYKLEPATVIPWWVSLLPIVIVIIFVVAIYIYFIKHAGAAGGGRIGSFGKTKAKVATVDNKKRVLFSDVAGADEEKEELKEVVEFLKNPNHFTKLGAKIPHGVLLVGPPGTGKTLLAKAVAGEAGVPFFSISGSDFVEMYVGVGASRVRDLFEKARSAPASIIFIDEIDAVGRHRGAGLGGGHDEREQTLNQLLVEMDGFSGNEGVIVIAATNRPDILDPALLRPGRFDRQVTVHYPDINGREQILNVHAKGKPFEKDVDLAQIAKTTIGFTGADLANLLNEAALLAARREKALIGMNDIEDAIMKIVVGTQKKSMRMSEKERLNTAYHEAGHAIVAYRLPKIDPVRQISIIPSGRALGYTLTVPEEDRHSVYKEELLQNIAMTLGGRAAERIIFGDYTGGAAGDIKSATGTAHRMVTELGMSDKLGPVLLGEDSGEVFLGRNFSSTPNYSEKTAALIDEEVQSIINSGYAQAEEILRTDIEKLHFIAKYLVAHETIDAEQFELIMTKDDVTEEDVLAIVSEKQKRSEAENEEKRKRDDERAKKQEERRKNAKSQFGPEGYPVGGYQDDTPPTDNNEIQH
ncbi:MAG: ATP-dependent zinc metalloprotease FtsH [Clostridia bacterium]|nr:ATP-dependent zinc metalloprotease FtsH [Clostridia bacterium]